MEDNVNHRITILKSLTTVVIIGNIIAICGNGYSIQFLQTLKDVYDQNPHCSQIDGREYNIRNGEIIMESERFLGILAHETPQSTVKALIRIPMHELSFNSPYIGKRIHVWGLLRCLDRAPLMEKRRTREPFTNRNLQLDDLFSEAYMLAVNFGIILDKRESLRIYYLEIQTFSQLD